MTTGVLEKLFGSPARIKIIRLFLLNPQDLFAAKEVARRCRINAVLARKETTLLKKIGFLQEKTETVDELIELKKGELKNKHRKTKITGLRLNESFPFISALKDLVLNAFPIDRAKIIKSFQSSGKMKLIVFSGVFIQSDDSRVDLLLVGDGVKQGVMETILRKMEAEIGKELTYAFFTTKEFLYRVGIYDRFVYDILDYPHEKILNKLDI